MNPFIFGSVGDGGGAAAVIQTTAMWLKSGETSDSYGTNTDGYNEHGRGGGWGVLSKPNKFGTYDRFTNTTGGTSFATDKIMLDHEFRDPETGVLPGYDIADVVTARTWDAHRTYAASKVKDGWSGWNGIIEQAIYSLRRQGSVYSLNWAPLNFNGSGTGDYFYVFTTNHAVTTEAWLWFNYSTVPDQSRAKSGSYPTMFYRLFTLSDAGVLS